MKTVATPCDPHEGFLALALGLRLLFLLSSIAAKQGLRTVCEWLQHGLHSCIVVNIHKGLVVSRPDPVKIAGKTATGSGDMHHTKLGQL